MDDSRTAFDQIVELFRDDGVRFIVIDGQAEWLFGSERVTYDIDLCYQRTPENLERLAKALKALKPTLRGAPPDLPFVLDAKSLALGNNFTLSTLADDLDLLGHVEPIGGFEELSKNAESITYNGRLLAIIGLDDLIRIKRHINRPKDRDSLMHLLAIKRIRDEQTGRG